MKLELLGAAAVHIAAGIKVVAGAQMHDVVRQGLLWQCSVTLKVYGAVLRPCFMHERFLFVGCKPAILATEIFHALWGRSFETRRCFASDAWTMDKGGLC